MATLKDNIKRVHISIGWENDNSTLNHIEFIKEKVIMVDTK
eukprot:CAMPEP_0196761574 /NCGR_PEP_ID=MMETSP1095-20130614/860_1 /TAXON_ID=96789 ORGANISM="Chromulina nebulosa, Strain UTEXLB2642" /NCGR_SAMPLE_ID=MMETSP1095 /ASSEMBLY_ACC=CAM_ASM_000446 /LENGTH=40 /DNA_ID= /DNA_START= /DNA_END= /DNA_ORIENTATION=